MVQVMQALGVEAMTAHWEFTYGADRVKELTESMKIPFHCGNVKDTGFGDPVFESTKFFERGGVKIAVIGPAFPYTPIDRKSVVSGKRVSVRVDHGRPLPIQQ